MSPELVLELVGYAASLLVAASLMMSSILRLRVINLMGAATFAVYGLLIQAYPVAAVNLLIVVINVFHLRKMLGTREYFALLEVEPDSTYLRAFLRFHAVQILRYFPKFEAPARPDIALFILRDLVPAGLLLGHVEGSTLTVLLDFVIPQYRDLKVGRYLFDERCEYFVARGIREVVAEAHSPDHVDYLVKIGFRAVRSDSGAPVYRLELSC